MFNASAANPQALETDTLPFEVQIFGAVDIAADVEHRDVEGVIPEVGVRLTPSGRAAESRGLPATMAA